MEKLYTMPIYQKIALDIANNIYMGNIDEGSTLHGRSTLAAKYNVSPETIRRSIKLLEDMHVVQSVKGRGVIVISSKDAESFLKKYKNVTNISSYKSDLSSLLNSRAKLESQILETVNKIVDYSSRLSAINPLVPFEFEINSDCKFIGMTASKTNFWQNTGGTIVAVKRSGELIISPGPDVDFIENDILLVVGDIDTHSSVLKFLYGTEEFV
jgi:K+/H+ antiporter YhaU regulatory subunit KhtT